MMRTNRLRSLLTLSALTGCAIATNVTGCGGSGSTAVDLLGADGSADGESSGGDGAASSSGSSSSGSSSSSSSSSGDATTSSGGDDGGASSSSSGGDDGGDASGSSGGDANVDSSSSGGDAAPDAGSSSGGDAGSDAASSSGGDAGSDSGADSGSSCPDGAACSTGTGNGTCSGGSCVACTAGAGINAACTTAYGGASNPYVCVAGSCVPGNCTGSGECTTAGQPTCGFSTPDVCGGCANDSQCPNNDICVTAAFDAGAVQGTCVPKGSGGCPGATASACPANPSDECCGGNCVVGNCCVGLTPNGCNGAVTTCAPEGSGGGICTTCTAVSGSSPTYYVDPVRGSDTDGTGNIGSSAACAFQTITRALQVIGANAPTNTTIDVVGGTLDAGVVTVHGVTGAPPAGQERFPLDIGANITVTGSGGPVVVDVPAATGGAVNTVGFILSGANAGIVGGATTLTISGQQQTASIGVIATSGPTTLGGVTVASFLDEAVLVQNSAAGGAAPASLTIGGNTTLSGNGTDGLLVSSGTATVTGVAGQPITFSGNGAHGVRVSGAGVLTMTGNLGATPPTTADVVASNNAAAGIWVQNTTATTRSTLTGIVSTGSTAGNGIRIVPGSDVRVRGSWLLGNMLDGIDVENNTGGASAVLTNIDLGTGTAGGDAGGNTLQSATATANGGAGICLRLPALSVAGVTLNAKGNFFQASNCQTTAGTLVTATGRACTGGSDVGGNIAATAAAAGNKIAANMCSNL